MTEAIGMQYVSLPSSVCQATLAESGKLASAGLPLSFSRWPFLYRSSDTSNGRHVIRSPALPEARRALSTELYSGAAVGVNLTVMPGCDLVNAGSSTVSHSVLSSVRQLSSVNVPALACATQARARTPSAIERNGVVMGGIPSCVK